MKHWDAGQHDLTPWHQYSLSVLVYAYREFEKRVGELTTTPGAKSQTVRRCSRHSVPTRPLPSLTWSALAQP